MHVTVLAVVVPARRCAIMLCRGAHSLVLPCDCCLCVTQVAYCTAAVAFEDGRRPQFEIPYDMVVVGVGEQPATFGVPGRQQ